jgi:integrase
MRFHLKRSAAIVRQICSEDLQTALRVKARLMSQSPDGSEDDICWVWHTLARRFSSVLDYEYTNGQIRWAWRMVRQSRRREDKLGAGGPRPYARRCRREALQRLADELRRRRTELLRLNVDDYDARDRTLTINEGTCRVLFVLSPAAGRAAERWLQVRGRQRGLLFELPSLPEFWEESLSDHPEATRVALAQDEARQVEEEDTLESLCEDKSELACAFVLKNMADRGGDWSAGFLERFSQRSGGLATHVFTKSERRTCLRAFSNSPRRNRRRSYGQPSRPEET